MSRPSWENAPPPAAPARPSGVGLGRALRQALWFPFSPALWARSAWVPLWKTVLLIYAYTVLCSLIIGSLVGFAFWGGLLDFGETFDAQWSPMSVSSDGELTVLGDRPYREAWNNILVAVDPDREMSLEPMEYPSRIIIERRHIVQEGGFAGQKLEIKRLMNELGASEAHIDGAGIVRFARQNKIDIILVVMVLAGVFYTLAGWGAAFLYALLGAYFAYSMAGRFKGMTFGQCFRIAMAAMAGKLAINVVLAPLLDYHFAFPIFALIIVALTLFAVSYIPALPQETSDRP